MKLPPCTHATFCVLSAVPTRVHVYVLKRGTKNFLYGIRQCLALFWNTRPVARAKVQKWDTRTGLGRIRRRGPEGVGRRRRRL
eukprot:5180538-Prymnesium_polylepis.1